MHLEEDVELLRHDGSWLPVDDSAAPVRDDDGTVLGAVIVFRDSSERQRLAQRQREIDRKLHQAEKLQAIGVLAGGLAHDLNNVLTAIMGYVEICRLESQDPPLGPLKEIERNVDAAAALCNQMLAGAGSGPLERQPVDVRALIEECVARERARMAPELELKVEPARSAVLALGDRAQLGQVVSNLLRNAIEAIEERPGTVSVT